MKNVIIARLRLTYLAVSFPLDAMYGLDVVAQTLCCCDTAAQCDGAYIALVSFFNLKWSHIFDRLCLFLCPSSVSLELFVFSLLEPSSSICRVDAAAGRTNATRCFLYSEVQWSCGNFTFTTEGSGHRRVYENKTKHRGVAGCMATVIHDAIMNPAEVVKQRMQMFNSPYRRVLHCISSLLRREGPAAFYRSYTTQLTMNIPFQALHFMTYESLQETLNPHRQYNPTSHMVSGALAGALAAAATTPLDVCKTLLNTQEAQVVMIQAQGAGAVGGRHISGLGKAFRTVYRTGGAAAFFKGVQARVIYQMPSTAISWSVYEFFKYIITKRQHERLLK